MRQIDYCSVSTNGGPASASHNKIKIPKPNYYETPAQDANSQKGHLPWTSHGICERYPGSKSQNVAMYYLWDAPCCSKRFNLKIQTTCSEWLKDALSSVMNGAVASAWGRFGSMQLDPNVDPTVIPVRQIYHFTSTLLWDSIDALWDMRVLLWDK